jgi:DNA-binding beta-propeller fold protein YncE
MRFLTPLKVRSAAAAIALLAGCSGSSAIAPKPVTPQGGAPSVGGRVSIVNHYSCPATGRIVYLSDSNNNIINIYAGKFHDQAPCGQLTSGLNGPYGVHVDPGTHDLYVANANNSNILVFHKGQTTPYNLYSDPSGQQQPIDVTVATDGTVVASNQGVWVGTEAGSISTWIGGPNGGTFVGNFPMTNDIQGGFLALKKNGTVYFNDIDATSKRGALWSVSCPAGACGAQTRVTGVWFDNPGGMGFDSTGDLFVNDMHIRRDGTAKTFELPNPKPTKFSLHAMPFGLAIDESMHHWFMSDWLGDFAAEYAYPSGTLVGTVSGNQYGQTRGIAIDSGR